jgi:hypothetical protein
LEDGALITEGQQIITGVHPRTAIGMSADGREVILLVADGRSHSVGVSHEQLAQLMLEAGAYNAMHLDGGGSSEMHISRAGTDRLTRVNHPSGGFERRVINALGLYVNAPIGNISSVSVDIPDVVIVSAPARFTVYALDEYMRRIDLPHGMANITVGGDSGNISQNYFTAGSQGMYTLNVSYAGFTAHKNVYATHLFEINPNVSEIRTYTGGVSYLRFTGVGADGNVFAIEPHAVNIEVVPPSLGFVMDGIFTATSLGAGWLKCTVGGVSAYIPVYATIQVKLIDQLSGANPMSFSSSHANVTSVAFYTPIPNFARPVATLMYRFDAAEHTQAAYADFENITSDGAIGFMLAVFGDLSGHWLRGMVTGSDGRYHLIDFARVIDWEGWQDVIAWLPGDVAYPVTLDRIYVASLSADQETPGQIWFSNLRGLYDYTDSFPGVVTPPSDRFKDGMREVFYEFSDYGYDITFMPDASAPPAGRAIETRAMDLFLFNASAGVYMGSFSDEFHRDRAWVLQHNRTHLVEYRPHFSTFGLGDLFVIQMTAADKNPGGNSGFMFADINQWAQIKFAIDISYTRNIMLLTDVSPLDFSNKAEYALLHALLVRYARNGYNFFVLSPGNVTEPDIRVIDGVRYMKFGPLYSNGILNEGFSVLRIRMWDGDIRYSIDRIH